MTVEELQKYLDNFDKNEEVFLWNGNWPSENYSTFIAIDRYNSVQTPDGQHILNPLVIHSYSRPVQ